MEQITLSMQNISDLLQNSSVLVQGCQINLSSIQSDMLQRNTNYPYVLTKEDLCELFRFGKTKMDKMLNANVLPVVQIGKDYRVTRKQIDDWFKRNSGKHILF
ncbi:MAG: helix-turn-helix domain-containing protein [Firmicutes bacterium]|jgi:excisionase family DNA binding protein|nr:helix-turn-helix domain-containing protein [Bacillota bacterium]